MAEERPDRDALFDEGPWLRPLARRLVRDADECDEAVQEARIAAWRHPPTRAEAGRAWLRAVLLNSVRARHRAEKRLKEREAVAARDLVPVDSGEELFLNAELAQRLAAAVAALPAPLRRVVLLRYWEEQSSFEIAARLGLPAGTVRRQLKMAVDRLRAALDREYGQRRTWALLIAPGLCARAPGAAATREPPPRSAQLPRATRSLGTIGAAGIAAIVLVTALAGEGSSGERAAATQRPGRAPEHRESGLRRLPPPSFVTGPRAPGIAAPADATLAGRVLDARGIAVPGATVTLGEDASRAWIPSRRFVTTADAAGNFRVVAPVGQYGVKVAAPGHAPTADFVHLDGDMRRDLWLVPTGRLVGAVHGDRGPAAEVDVWAVDERGARAALGRTTGRGTFELLVAPGVYRVHARGGSQTGSAGPANVRGGEASTLTVTLAPGATLRGRVLDPQGRGRAEVAITIVGVGAPPVVVESAAGGLFAAAGLVPGALALHARAADGEAVATVDLPALPAAAVATELRLSPAVRLEGEVVDRLGRPVQGVEMTAHRAWKGEQETAPLVLSDERGHFSFPTPLAGRTTLVARHPVSGVALVERGAATAGDTPGPLRLVLEPAASVAGVVRFDDGAPAEGVRVQALVEPHAGGGGFAASVMTGADGTFSIGALGPGTGHVTAAWKMAPLAIRGLDGLGFPYRTALSLEAGEARDGLVLVIPRPGGSLRGVVTDESGRPIAGAAVAITLEGKGAVVAEEGRTFTDDAGKFVFPTSAEGHHTLRVDAPGLAPATVSAVRDGAPPLRIRLMAPR